MWLDCGARHFKLLGMLCESVWSFDFDCDNITCNIRLLILPVQRFEIRSIPLSLGRDLHTASLFHEIFDAPSMIVNTSSKQRK